MNGTDVFSDILNGPRYKGAVSGLKGVTSVMDTIFISFISICAFFIISCALLRNVVAGVYASYPAFFDKVHDAKLYMVDKVNGKGTMGSIGAFFFSMVPDFKEMSEFKDDTIQPKDYFLKAIPQMICVVMIGVVIYNGYYRDFVVMVAKFGSTMIERVLFKVDPVEVFDNLTNSFGTPTLGSDANPDDDQSALVSTITKNMYAKTISFYTDIETAQAKTALATKLETWVSSKIKDVAQYTDKTAYESSYQVDRVLGSVDVSTLNKTTDETVIRAWVVPYSDFGIDSAQHQGEDWRMRVIVKFTKIHNGTTSSGTITNAQLQVPSSYKTTPTGHSDYDLIKMSSAEMKGLNAGNSFKVGGIAAQITSDGIQIFGHLSASGSGSYDVTDLYYQDATSPSNIVKTISFGSSKVQYKDLDGNVPDWNSGDDTSVTDTAATDKKGNTSTSSNSTASNKNTNKKQATDTSNSTN